MQGRFGAFFRATFGTTTRKMQAMRPPKKSLHFGPCGPASHRELNNFFCPLSRKLLWIVLQPGNFTLKNGGDFWWIFSGLRFPRNEARKLLKTFGENSEQNSWQNSGRKFKNFVLQLFWPKLNKHIRGAHINILETPWTAKWPWDTKPMARPILRG